MILEKSLFVVRNLTRFLFFLKVIPFRWNSSQQKYSYSQRKNYLTYVHLLFPILHLLLSLIYLVGCAVKIPIHSASCTEVFISSSLFTATFMTFIVISYATMLQNGLHQVPIAHNLLEKFVTKVKRDFLRQEKFAHAKFFIHLDRLIFIVPGLLILIGILSSLKCWVLPDLPSYFTSLIPRDTVFAHLTRLLVSILFSYFAFSSTVLFSFITAHMMSSMPMFVIFMQTELRPGLDSSRYLTNSSLRNLTNLPCFYRQVEILLRILTDVYALLLIPTEWLLIGALICCNCCFILYRDYLNKLQLISLTNVLVVSWSIILGLYEVGGRFDKYSRRTLLTWKRYQKWWQLKDSLKIGKGERKYILKFAASCKPLKFGYKSYRKIQRTALLVIVKSIAVNTFRAIKMLR